MYPEELRFNLLKRSSEDSSEGTAGPTRPGRAKKGKLGQFRSRSAKVATVCGIDRGYYCATFGI